MALLDSRWQTSRAVAVVKRSSGERPMYRSVSRMRSSGITLRKGESDELDCQRLPERVVENRIAGRIGEVRQDDGVAFHECMRGAQIEIAANAQKHCRKHGQSRVERDAKYPADAVVFSNDSDGSHTLKELRFGGQKQVLVFGET